jgi:hypothetical protein
MKRRRKAVGLVHAAIGVSVLGAAAVGVGYLMVSLGANVGRWGGHRIHPSSAARRWGQRGAPASPHHPAGVGRRGTG